MMRLEYDPLLLEKTVRLAVRRDAGLEHELHRAIDPMYAISDSEQRDRAFADVFADWFRRLGLGGMLDGLIAERPRIAQHVSRGIVREAARRESQGVELYVRSTPDDANRTCRTLMIQLCPHSFTEPERVRPLLRRELLHVSDMLDEAFGFDARDLEAISPSEQIVRDRYRVLWDVQVEERLRREGHVSSDGCAQLRRAFQRVLGARGGAPADDAFERFRAMVPVAHRRLMEIARNPKSLEAQLLWDRADFKAAGSTETRRNRGGTDTGGEINEPHSSERECAAI